MKIRKNVSEFLDDCMKTVKEIEPTKEAVKKYLSDYYGKEVDIDTITVEKYGTFDERIGWDTYIVCIDGNAVGFTNEKLAD
jgi:hypothetical protein